MNAPSHNSDPRRQFAYDVVVKLREAGFQSLWAGGCVRDALLGKTPKDYDVASDATPEDVVTMFGRRRTVTVGASFGVVMVLGPDKASGQVEVAAFRSDGAYLDGRRPSSVRFSTPEEDAQRRDFTINGMFYDPIREEVIDFVGGRQDLKDGLVRAIGSATARFEEDKLRLLRAVRFAATFGYKLEPETERAISTHRAGLSQVSVERITQELRRMLADSGRARAFQLLASSGLIEVIFPELTGSDRPAEQPYNAELTARILSGLVSDRFEPALAAILLPLHGGNETPSDFRRTSAISRKGRQLKLSTEETECVEWLVRSQDVLTKIASRPLHQLKPLLADDRSAMLLDLSTAIALATAAEPVDADYCRRYLSQNSAAVLNPGPLVDGRDVRNLSVPAGPLFRQLLETIRREQLDEQLISRESALRRLSELAKQL